MGIKYKISDGKKNKIKNRDGFRCWYCGRRFRKKTGVKPTMDHQRPRSKGGDSHVDNLVYACADCNFDKADLTVEEYRRKVQRTRTRLGRALFHLERASDLSFDVAAVVATAIDQARQRTAVVFAGEVPRTTDPRESATHSSPPTPLKTAGPLASVWSWLVGLVGLAGDRGRPRGVESRRPKGSSSN